MYKKYQNLIIFIILTFITAWADLFTKEYVFRIVPYNSSIEVFSFFDLVRVRNYGISFGLFQSPEFGKYVFPIIASLICLYLIYNMVKANSLKVSVATSLIVGGAIGNSIDRIKNNSVADFLHFHYKEYSWPSFNLADTTIFIGVVIIFIYDIFQEKKKSENKNA